MEPAEIEKRFRRLRKDLVEGAINDGEFKAEVERLRFVDDQGREWMIGAYSGKWYYLAEDGEWVQDEPAELAGDGATCKTCGRPVKAGVDFCDECLAQKATIPAFSSVPVETVGAQPERSRVPWALLVIVGLFAIGAVIFRFVSFGRPVGERPTVQAVATAPETAESPAPTAAEATTAPTVAEATPELGVTSESPTVEEAATAPTIAEATPELAVTAESPTVEEAATAPTVAEATPELAVTSESPTVEEAATAPTVAEATPKLAVTSTPLVSQVSTPTATARLSPTVTSSPSPAPPTLEPTDTATSESSPSPTIVETAAVSATEELIPSPESLLTGVIAFSVFDPERATYDIYTINADGSGRQKVVSDASQPAFSPNGTELAFRSWDPTERGRGLFVHDFTGQRIDWKFTSHGPASRPNWASNGQFFLFHSRQESDRKSRIYYTVGTEVHTLRRPDVNKDVFGEMPALLTDARFVYSACEFGKCGIIMRDISGAYPQHLTEDPSDTAPAPSPDGKKIAFMSQRNGNWEIYVTNADGSDIARLTENPANDGLPVWSPDGRYIAFASDRGDEWAVWIMRPDGSEQRQLFALGGSLDGRVHDGAEHDTLGWIEERISWKP